MFDPCVTLGTEVYLEACLVSLDGEGFCYIPIKNYSEHPVHIRKGQTLGHMSEVQRVLTVSCQVEDEETREGGKATHSRTSLRHSECMGEIDHDLEGIEVENRVEVNSAGNSTHAPLPGGRQKDPQGDTLVSEEASGRLPSWHSEGVSCPSHLRYVLPDTGLTAQPRAEAEALITECSDVFVALTAK